MSAAANVTGNSRFSASLNQVVSTGVISANTLAAILSQSPTYVNAASGAVNTLDALYAAQLTIGTSPTALNMASGGALKDLAGNTLTFGRVRELVVQVVTTTAGVYCNVYSAASNGWTVGLPPIANQLLVPAGGMLHLSDPLSFGGTAGLYVGASTGTWDIVASTAGVIVNVIIAGCSVT